MVRTSKHLCLTTTTVVNLFFNPSENLVGAIDPLPRKIHRQNILINYLTFQL